MITDQKAPFRISLAEATSPVWLRLKQHYQERLERLRLENDSQSLDEKATAAQRAKIAEAKYFLDLDKELPVQVE